MEQRRDIENTKPACRLILASASPRRRELLERIGLKPEIHPSTLEENPLCTEPAQVVMELAGQKARDVMAQVREEARTTGIPFSGIIIGSDTVVSVDDEILGKPADRDEALEMIGRIQGRDEILGQIERLNREHGLTILVVSHSMEDMARYVDRIMVMNDGVKMFDDTPKEVFRHYKELEAIGLAAPQITYVVQGLRERGIPIDDAITTVEEAREAILALYNKRREKQ